MTSPLGRSQQGQPKRVRTLSFGHPVIWGPHVGGVTKEQLAADSPRVAQGFPMQPPGKRWQERSRWQPLLLCGSLETSKAALHDPWRVRWQRESYRWKSFFCSWIYGGNARQPHTTPGDPGSGGGKRSLWGPCPCCLVPRSLPVNSAQSSVCLRRSNSHDSQWSLLPGNSPQLLLIGCTQI